MITYITNEYGLRGKDMAYMLALFAQMPAVERVMLYGSRAKGTFAIGADVDLAIMGANVTQEDIGRIHYLLENESPTLLWFDVLHYDSLKSEALKRQIDDYGKVIYSISYSQLK